MRHIFIILSLFLLGSLGCNSEDQQAAETNSQDVKTEDVAPFDPTKGLVRYQSNLSAKATFQALKEAVQNNPKLNIMAEIDHQQNAEQAGLPLPPTYLLIFGNPELGTPLMRSARSLGLDLPQKMLVYEDMVGNVWVAYNDPFYLRSRHSFEGQDEELNKISNVLKSLAEAATQEQAAR